MTACWCRLIQPENNRRKKVSGDGSGSMAGSLPQCRAPFDGFEIGHLRPCTGLRLTRQAFATASTREGSLRSELGPNSAQGRGMRTGMVVMRLVGYKD